MVNAVVPGEQLDAHVRTVADTLCNHATLTLAATDEAVRRIVSEGASRYDERKRRRRAERVIWSSRSSNRRFACRCRIILLQRRANDPLLPGASSDRPAAPRSPRHDNLAAKQDPATSTTGRPTRWQPGPSVGIGADIPPERPLKPQALAAPPEATARGHTS